MDSLLQKDFSTKAKMGLQRAAVKLWPHMTIENMSRQKTVSRFSISAQRASAKVDPKGLRRLYEKQSPF